MDPQFQQETANLVRSWGQYDQSMLRDYLVEGVEDPRLNVQSILTRHCLLVALFGRQFDWLLELELQFGVVLNWMLRTFPKLGGPEDAAGIQHALASGADSAESCPIPPYVSRAFSSLPSSGHGVEIPNYIRHILQRAVAGSAAPSLEPEDLRLFQHIWKQVLHSQEAARLSVLEAACGSANDYRFLDAFGLAAFLDYAGFDLCEKNIRNAVSLFPTGGFFVGNAFALGVRAASFDYTVVHDLLEHLSLEAMEQAVAELCRVTRKGLCLGLFNAHEGAEHAVRPVDDYHWNSLSVPRLLALLENHGFHVQVIHIGTFLKWRFGCAETHNPNAYTLSAERVQGSPPAG